MMAKYSVTVLIGKVCYGLVDTRSEDDGNHNTVGATDARCKRAKEYVRKTVSSSTNHPTTSSEPKIYPFRYLLGKERV